MIDAQAKLQKVHDIIKKHPFRDSFDPKWISDYKHCLYELTSVWADYIYRGAFASESEKKIAWQFGYWIHNYRQELRTYIKDSFPMRYFDYYERMLQVTHLFIETGSMEFYYDIDCLWNDAGILYRNVETYELITKEKCGIDSPILPRYFPVKYSLVADDDKIKKYFETDYTFRNDTEEKRAERFQEWVTNVKPVIEWINSRHEETPAKHATWVSVKM